MPKNSSRNSLMLKIPEIFCEQVYASPWVRLMAKTFTPWGKHHPETYHSLRQADYVTVFAITTDGKIPVVRQFRPALNKVTIELPGGLLEPRDNPRERAILELQEETGMQPTSDLIDLGCLAPDTGRLENHLWGYFATVTVPANDSWVPEVGVEVELIPVSELKRLILTGEFDHALHIALIGLASFRGLFPWQYETTEHG
jgi:ADP-ribose pyrophosphatase